jgi:hypothetical protein
MHDLTEMLAGAGLAARYVSDPVIWDGFTRWMLDKGYLEPHERDLFSRENMALSSLTLYSVLTEVQEVLRGE